MISNTDRLNILALCRKYRAVKAVLFGSSAGENPSAAKDIDIGVEGVAPGRFFETLR